MNSNLLNRPIKNLFYVFGFGWCGDGPESVYVVPARELYDYDKDTRRITFPIKETEKEKMSRLERFRRKTIDAFCISSNGITWLYKLQSTVILFGSPSIFVAKAITGI